MDKDKPIDRKDNNLENKIEDYKDSSGNPEAFIEDMTDPEATAIFKEAFYAEGKALEEEALRSSFVEDEEKKEALRLRILAAAGRSADESAMRGADAAEVENAGWKIETVAGQKGEAETEMTAGENVKLEVKVMVDENVQRNEKARSAVVNEDDDLEKKKRHKFTSMVRWVAVIIIVCAGVFGVSMTSQAKGSGLWSSIQRLIGVETRWESENNGEDRTYTNPEEEKAVKDIEEKLEIEIPMFFYWPGKMKFSEYEIIVESGRFIMVYIDGDRTIYFEGRKGEVNISSNSVWQGEGKIEQVEYDGITYAITEADNDINEKYYYVNWTTDGNVFSLSGMTNCDELKKILENIKN